MNNSHIFLQRSLRVGWALFIPLLLHCGNPVNGTQDGGDAGAVTSDGGGTTRDGEAGTTQTDASGGDATDAIIPQDSASDSNVDAPNSDDTIVADASQPEASPPDAIGMDADSPDVLQPDVVSPPDGSSSEPAPDAAPPDAMIGMDAAEMDVASPPDVVIPPDNQPVDVPDAAPDVQVADVRPPDVVSDVPMSCGVSLSVTAPTAGQMIEACTASGTAVYFNFGAQLSGGTGSLIFNWRNPDGLLVAPPMMVAANPSAVARRQIGGNMIAGQPPPLTSAGGRNAIGGNWTLEVSTTDPCGRTLMATRNFTFTLESRPNRCPNP